MTKSSLSSRSSFHSIARIYKFNFFSLCVNVTVCSYVLLKKFNNNHMICVTERGVICRKITGDENIRENCSPTKHLDGSRALHFFFFFFFFFFPLQAAFYLTNSKNAFA
ncbi:hypothetical protein PUN28_015396 [Cardiocondyla obscurior]|uniref:Uncharacterized protein n=1 Tax=Cardiocondyla obscurior TaxID=286306 RepID=A0AAW2EVE3_9HYME